MSTNSLPSAYYFNGLALTLGQTRLRQLLAQYSTAQKVWEEINARPSLLSDKSRGNIVSRLANINLNDEWEKLGKNGIYLITQDDGEYPALLKTIHSPPLFLYVKGNSETLSYPCLAVVGTRSHSSYGKDVVERLIPHLTRAGISIVSGLAQGIDALSHQATLDAEGKTIAVLGCGIDFIETSSSRKIAKRIIDSGGAIVSEYPLGTPPLKQHFPARNRIIAGLSLGTLVIESRYPGGSLITAQHAVDEGREVFSVPGPITGAASEGTNKLIQEGAHAVVSAEDILDILNIAGQTSTRAPIPMDLSQKEQKIMDALELEALYIDEIVGRTSLAIHDANARLTALEIKGLVKNIGGNTYQRIR